MSGSGNDGGEKPPDMKKYEGMISYGVGCGDGEYFPFLEISGLIVNGEPLRLISQLATKDYKQAEAATHAIARALASQDMSTMISLPEPMRFEPNANKEESLSWN